MRVAVSNIGWTDVEDAEVLDLLIARGVDGIEIAPTRVFPDLDAVGPREARAFAAPLADRGLPVVAFQSLLFGLADADLFGPEPVRDRMAARLTAVIGLAAAMGAGPLVFGSPGARRPPVGMSAADATTAAAAFFRPLAAVAAGEGVVLCIEPNPPQYGCAFVTTADEGADLVAEVGSAGFGLHLDAAAMAMAGDDGSAAVERHSAILRHFHASAPQLGDLENEVVDHAGVGRALADVGYDGLVSIEMRAAEHGNAQRVRAALDLVAGAYGRPVA